MKKKTDLKVVDGSDKTLHDAMSVAVTEGTKAQIAKFAQKLGSNDNVIRVAMQALTEFYEFRQNGGSILLVPKDVTEDSVEKIQRYKFNF